MIRRIARALSWLPPGAAVLLFNAAATAQRLNLPDAPAPPAGANAAIIALADSLRHEGNGPDVSTDPRGAAVDSLRDLARALLLFADQSGPAGSPHALAGRKLARLLPALEAAIRAAPGAGGDARAAALSAGARALATKPPPKADDLDRALRDLLAPLAAGAPASTGPPAWLDDFPRDAAGADLAALSGAVGAAPGVSPEAAAALAALHGTLESASNWTAYTRAAAYARSTVSGAAGIIDHPPAWVIAPQRIALGEQFSEAVVLFAAPASRAAGVPALERLTTFARLAEGVDRLDQKPAANRLRAALAAAAVPPPDAADDQRRLAALDRALTLLLAARTAGDENAVVKPLRPTWRTLAAAARDSEARLLDAMPDLLTRADALTNPGMLTVLSAHRRAVDDLRAVREISAALDGPGEPTGPVADPSPDTRRAADRLARLGVELNAADKRDSALATIRAFAVDAEAFTDLAAETALARIAAGGGGGADPDEGAWVACSGSRIAELSKEIEARRRAWLDAWARDPAGAKAERDKMLAVATLASLMSDAVVFRAIAEGRAAYLPRAAPWELSAEACAAAAEGLESLLAECTRLAVTGSHADCLKRLDDAKVRYAVVELGAALERSARERLRAQGAAPPPPDAPEDARALVELASGAPYPGRTWLSDQRADLAEVCRYSEEIAASRRLGAADRTDKLLRYVGAKAERVRASLAAAKH